MTERPDLLRSIAEGWTGEESALLRILFNLGLDAEKWNGWEYSKIWRITYRFLEIGSIQEALKYLQTVFPPSCDIDVRIANAGADIWSAIEWGNDSGRDPIILLPRLYHSDSLLLARIINSLPSARRVLLLNACQPYYDDTAVEVHEDLAEDPADAIKVYGSVLFAGVAAATVGLAIGASATVGAATFVAGNVAAVAGIYAYSKGKPVYEQWQKWKETDEACRVLGVDRNATKKEIDTAYKEKMLISHPDKGGTDEAVHLLTRSKVLLLENIYSHSD